jgi:hypothetical protein
MLDLYGGLGAAAHPCGSAYRQFRKLEADQPRPGGAGGQGWITTAFLLEG